MKKYVWVILILSLCSSCIPSNLESEIIENFNVGEQGVIIHFSSLKSIYEKSSPISITLEIENKSNLPIYLPWGLDPGYVLIVVSLDSSSRTTFGKRLPTPSTDFHAFQIISPGEVISSSLIVPLQKDAGDYNLCAEVLILGENGSDHIKPRICVPIKYIE